MKVKHLIEQLQQHNPEDVVVYLPRNLRHEGIGLVTSLSDVEAKISGFVDPDSYNGVVELA